MTLVGGLDLLLGCLLSDINVMLLGIRMDRGI